MRMLRTLALGTPEYERLSSQERAAIYQWSQQMGLPKYPVAITLQGEGAVTVEYIPLSGSGELRVENGAYIYEERQFAVAEPPPPCWPWAGG